MLMKLIQVKRTLTWCGRLKLVKEKFEIANNDKLSGPALLHAARFGNLDVTLVGCSNAASRINAQRTLGCKKITREKKLKIGNEVD